MNTVNNYYTLRQIVDGVGIIMQISLFGIFLYHLIISVFGWVKRKEVSALNFPIKNKFAIIISAHNEEVVIGKAVDSLKNVHYPTHMYDIFVIADNCTDNTAKVAAGHEAIVYERFDDEKRGKGFALQWMFKNLSDMKDEYNAVCVLDADNLVSPNFLLEMNKHLCMGDKVIQGYLDSKNPCDSWVSSNYSISYWTSNRLFQLPRYYLGLSCALGGTGFVASMKVIDELGWDATCLTEDLEFSMKLVLNGMRVSWSHEAIVYDEKPLHLVQSWKQRKRWMQGHADCASRFTKKLIAKAVKDRDMVAFDSALYLIQPFVIVANGIGMLIAGINLIFFTKFSEIFSLKGILGMLLILAATYFNIIFVFVEGKLNSKIVKYFITFPIYSLTWVPIIFQGFMDKNKKEWVHTTHTRSLDIADMGKAK